VALAGLMAWHEISFVARAGSLHLRQGERKFSAAAEYVRDRLPANAAVFTMQHSGSVNYYTGRQIVRYDMIPPRDLDDVVREFDALGYHPYFLLEDWEEDVFKQRFDGHSVLAALDWPPAAMILHETRVRIYDPADYGRSPARVTELVPIGREGR
jgi:hypothetical protein